MTPTQMCCLSFSRWLPRSNSSTNSEQWNSLATMLSFLRSKPQMSTLFIAPNILTDRMRTTQCKKFNVKFSVVRRIDIDFCRYHENIRGVQVMIQSTIKVHSITSYVICNKFSLYQPVCIILSKRVFIRVHDVQEDGSHNYEEVQKYKYLACIA